MNQSADAADQVVKISLEGMEWAVRLAGSGAKRIAVMIYAMIKEQNKTRGRERLSNMLRSGKPLKVYTFQSRDLDKFKEVAKQYGILYTILKEKDKTGDVFDVLVRADDESKINRIIDRFSLTKIDTASIKAEILGEAPLENEEDMEEADGSTKTEMKTKQPNEQTTDKKDEASGQVPPIPEQSKEEYEEGVAQKLLSDKPIQKEEHQNPAPARMERNERTPHRSTQKVQEKAKMSEDLSEPTSKNTKEENSSVLSDNQIDSRESVRKRIDRIKKERERISGSTVRESIKAPKSKER